MKIMIRFLPKVLILLLLASFVFIGRAWAAEEAWFEQTPQEFGQNLETAKDKDSVSLEPFSFAAFNNLANSVSIAGAGNPRAPQGSVQRKGAIGVTGGLIATLYANPAASSGEYLAYLGKEMGVVQPAFAADQGTGFGGLTPILPIWAAIRNVTYIIFIILFLVTGLLIMFRMKINPQTVISVQNALPRIVITLILITFSYAIAGFLIDLMYVLMFIVSSIFTSFTSPALVPGFDLTRYLGDNIVTIFFRLPGLGGTPIGTAAGVVGEIVNTIAAEGIAGNILGIAVAGITAAVLTIAVLWALFRLFFSLLKAYIFVLALVIFGPLMLLADALPGRGGGLSSWIRGLAANLLVFPFVLVMFLFASALLQPSVVRTGEVGWLAPFLGGGWGSDQFKALLALGIILLTPQALKMLEDAFKPPPFPYGAGIGQAIGVGTGYPVAVGRGIGATIAGSREYMVTGFGTRGEAQYGQRGYTRTFLGRLFGR